MKCNESATRQNPIESLKFDASSKKFDASWHGLSEVTFSFIPYKLNFIAIGYKKNLFMFNSYNLTKQFKKMGGSCVFVFVISEERVQLELF